MAETHKTPPIFWKDIPFAPHEGLGEFNKASWEEPVNPEGFSPNDAGFQGGEPQPTPPPTASVLSDEDFGTGDLTKITQQLFSPDATPEPS